MKKRNIVTLVVTLALVAVVGLGSTIAFLSDKAGEVTNTFTFSQQGISIILDEAQVVSDGAGGYDKDETKGRVTTNAYTDLLPGAELYKDPSVTVEKDSIDCYVFVSVTNANGKNLTIDAIGSAWKEITLPSNATGVQDTKYYVYVAKTQAAAVVAKSDESKTLDPVFTGVTVSSDLEQITTFSNIVIKAAAVQAANNTIENATQEALSLLGVSFSTVTE